jgi:hypothetical protein
MALNDRQRRANLIPLPSFCVYNVCGMCKEERKKKWRKILSQLCLSSDRWLMNCERSLSVSIQDQPDYVFRRSNMMRPARLFFLFEKIKAGVLLCNQITCHQLTTREYSRRSWAQNWNKQECADTAVYLVNAINGSSTDRCSNPPSLPLGGVT